MAVVLWGWEVGGGLDYGPQTGHFGCVGVGVGRSLLLGGSVWIRVWAPRAVAPEGVWVAVDGSGFVGAGVGEGWVFF